MQKIAIIASSKDTAGVNIRNNLIEIFDFEQTNDKFDNNTVHEYNKIKHKIIKLYLIDDDLIYSESIDRKIEADILIFVSKHRSKENMPTFTIHPIGNWNNADFGGQEKKLCFSSAVLFKNLFIELNKITKNTNYISTMEATHHGPYVEKPAIFVEIGSKETEWNNNLNGEIIAKTIINALKNQNNKYKFAFGIGGPHYCNNFNKIILRTDFAFSHICPKYMLEKLDEEMITQAIKKTLEKIDFVVLDWKGLGTEKQRIVELLKNFNIEVKRTDQVLKD